MKALRVPGLTVEEVFKRVRIAVTQVVNVSVNVQVQAPPGPPQFRATPGSARPGRFDGTWMGP